MSLRTMLWALSTKRTRSCTCRCVLMALADATPDDHGRHAFPTVAAIAEKVDVCERTVRRELAWMEQAGLIRRGDQSMVAKRPACLRPVVWDLDVDGPEPRCSANPDGNGSGGGDGDVAADSPGVSNSGSNGSEALETQGSGAGGTDCHPSSAEGVGDGVTDCHPLTDCHPRGDTGVTHITGKITISPLGVPPRGTTSQGDDGPMAGGGDAAAAVPRKAALALVEAHHALVGSLGLAPQRWPRREVEAAQWLLGTLVADGRTPDAAVGEALECVRWALSHGFHRSRVLTVRALAGDWPALRQDISSPRNQRQAAPAAPMPATVRRVGEPARAAASPVQAQAVPGQRRRRHTLMTPEGRMEYWGDEWSEPIAASALYEHFHGGDPESCPVCRSDSRNQAHHGAGARAAAGLAGRAADHGDAGDEGEAKRAAAAIEAFLGASR